MKSTYSNTEKLINRYDNQLKAILLNDLEVFKGSRGQFLSNSSSNEQRPEQVRLVA